MYALYLYIPAAESTLGRRSQPFCNVCVSLPSLRRVNIRPYKAATMAPQESLFPPFIQGIGC
jgi:hypothetical protein